MVESFRGFTMVVVSVHRVSSGAMLVQNIQFQRLGPPLGYWLVYGRVAAVSEGATSSSFHVHFIISNVKV